MTALNIWQDGRNAYILTDTAIYGPSGEVLSLHDKVVVLSDMAGGCRMALAGTGHVHPAVLAAALNERVNFDPRDTLMALPDIVKAIERERAKLWGGEESCEIGIVAAVYDPAIPSPALFMISNEAGRFVLDQPPHELLQIRYWTAGQEPYGPFVYEGPTGSGTITPFDPHSDGLAMIEAQRQNDKLFGNGCYVGGSAALVTIGPDGIDRQVLRDWGDEIGTVVRPIRG